MSSPAVVSVAMNTYWPQDHGIRIFKYGTLPLVSIGTELCDCGIQKNITIGKLESVN